MSIRKAEEDNGSRSTRGVDAVALGRHAAGLCVGAVVLDGTSLTINPTLEAITGHAATELDSLDAWFTTLFGRHAESERLRYESARAAGFRGLMYSVIERKDGEERTLEIARSRVDTSEFWIVRDVTMTIDLQDALIRARDAAEDAARAKAAFLTTMSHELRTPMNGVIGVLDLLLQTSLTPLQHEYAETVQCASEVLLALMTNILDYSYLETGRIILERVEFAPATAISEAVHPFSVVARQKGLALEVDCSEIEHTAVGDPDRLRQLVSSLVSNAVKFSSEGHVVVRARTTACVDDKVMLELRVSDTGIGVPLAMQERMFEPFTQADSGNARPRGGIGLGLATARAIVALMDGELTMKSDGERGSTFVATVLFRAGTTGSSIASHETPPLVSNAAPHAGHALVVDDNRVNAKIAVAILERLGWTADVAYDGEQAIAGVRRRRYDAVLMDCQMPVMDGFEATRRIRALPEGGQLLIVAQTAMAIVGDRERCLSAGMDEYVAKPLRPRELARVLSRATVRAA